jgi:DNA-binding MarR family transcriptional regulator
MHELMNGIAIAHRLSESLFTNLLGKEAVTGGQFAYILIIYENPGISEGEVSRRLRIDKGSVTRMVGKLQKNGYIEQRTAEHDKRAHCLFPTTAGIKAYRRIAPIAIRSEERLSNTLSSQETKELSRLLKKVTEGLEKTTEKTN